MRKTSLYFLMVPVLSNSFVLSCVDENKVCGDRMCLDSEVCHEDKCVPTDKVCGETICKDSEICHNNKCVDPEIKPTTCTEIADCPNGEICISGTCRVKNCETGSQCEGNILIGCTNNQVTIENCDKKTDSKFGYFCDAEKGACSPRQCAEGVAKCEGNVLIGCANNQVTIENCGEKAGAEHGHICDAAQSACVPRLCTEGAASCIGNVLTVCTNNENVTTDCSSFSGDSENGYLCDAKAKYCIPRNCVETSERCNIDNTIPQVCTDNAWKSNTTCNEEQECRLESGKAHCVPIQCNNGTLICREGAIRICNENSYEIEEDCASTGKICSAKSGTPTCIEPECTDSQVKCEYENKLAYNFQCEDGLWVKTQACADGFICNNPGTVGEICTEEGSESCTPEAKKCDIVDGVATVFVCKENNTWEKLEACDEGCNAAKDGCAEASTGCTNDVKKCEVDPNNDNRDTLYICKNGAWEVLEACELNAMCNIEAEGCEPKCQENDVKCDVVADKHINYMCIDSQWVEDLCDAGYVCKDPNVIGKECVAGGASCEKTVCADGTLTVCKNGSVFGDPIACESGCNDTNTDCANGVYCNFQALVHNKDVNFMDATGYGRVVTAITLTGGGIYCTNDLSLPVKEWTYGAKPVINEGFVDDGVREWSSNSIYNNVSAIQSGKNYCTFIATFKDAADKTVRYACLPNNHDETKSLPEALISDDDLYLAESQTRVITNTCGNGAIDDGEQCDGELLNDKTCEILVPDTTGTLGCKGCIFDTSQCLAGGVSWDYSETFDGTTNLTGSYATNSFESPNASGITWDYVGGRNNTIADTTAYQIEGPGILFKKGTISTTAPNGVGSITIEAKKAFTGAGNRVVKIILNDGEPCANHSWDNTDVQTIQCLNVNIAGNVSIKIESGSEKQVTIDNIRWTNYSE